MFQPSPLGQAHPSASGQTLSTSGSYDQPWQDQSGFWVIISVAGCKSAQPFFSRIKHMGMPALVALLYGDIWWLWLLGGDAYPLGLNFFPYCIVLDHASNRCLFCNSGPWGIRLGVRKAFHHFLNSAVEKIPRQMAEERYRFKCPRNQTFYWTFLVSDARVYAPALTFLESSTRNFLSRWDLRAMDFPHLALHLSRVTLLLFNSSNVPERKPGEHK